MLTFVKLAVSAGIIYFVNEFVVTRSKPLVGSMIASLPLVSLITFIWIYYAMKADPAERVEKLATHSTGVFWFVLPSLPMFLLLSYLLKKEVSFWVTLGICSVVTMILYLFMVLALKKFGIEM